MYDLMITLELLRKWHKTQCSFQLPYKEQNCPNTDILEAMDLREQGGMH